MRSKTLIFPFLLFTLFVFFGVLGVLVVETWRQFLFTARFSTMQNYLSKLPKQIIVTQNGQEYTIVTNSLITQESFLRAFPEPKYSSLFSYTLSKSAYNFPKNPFDEASVTSTLTSLQKQVFVPEKKPELLYSPDTSRSFSIIDGVQGRNLQVEKSVENILNIDLLQENDAELVVDITGNTLTPDSQIFVEKRASTFIDSTIVISFPSTKKELKAKEILPLLSLPSGYDLKKIETLVATISASFITESVEPKLTIQDREVIEFIPPREGRTIDTKLLTEKIKETLQKIENSQPYDALEAKIISLPVKTQLKSLNTLGIEEKIGVGESEYAHSIPNRVHNVSLTATKIHAKLVFPGEVFSFNEYLGDVSGKTGFKQAYIIKNGQTILGDGGGVCQVSSTLFRAVLNAGLPITERKGHSYRVGYYEQNSKPGFDATVYSPVPDFKFINDTTTPILISAIADSSNTFLEIELYGKSDGRTAKIENYKQWDNVSAPPAFYQDDPTLNAGVVKQIEYAASGLKTSFLYSVTYPDGTVKEKTFQTQYVPWRAVFLRGTKL